MTWAIGFVTLERPDAAQRFVRSARRMFPDVPVYVAEQSRTLGPMEEFYAAERVTVIRVPFDAGLSASRNALVEAMDVDYLALCDDDFILGPATSFTTAIRVLEQDGELGIVGGKLHDYDGATESIRNWEMFFDHDETNQRFTATPIYNYPPMARQVAGETVYLCDAVLNFSVFRRSIFSTGIRWEEGIKVNGEHEDFYLNLKKHSSCRVAYLPTMTALHWHMPRQGIYPQLRSRDDGRRKFMKKWRLVSHLEIGTGRRPLDDAPVHCWFAGTGAGAGRIAHSTANREGAAMEAPAGISQGLLYTAGQQDSALPATPVAGQSSCLDWINHGQQYCRPIPAGIFLFCYRPAVEPGGSLLLWYQAMHSRGNAAGEQDGAGVVLRWFSSRGEVLVWESEVHAINCSKERYWQPLVVSFPVWPRGGDNLRFEILSACEKRTPLATGFVFADSPAPQQTDPDESSGVLAWCRTPVQNGCAGKPLVELLASAPKLEVDVVRKAGQPWISMDVSDLEFLGIASGRTAEPSLTLAAGLCHASSTRAPLALPLDLVMDSDNLLFAARAGPAEECLFVMVPQLVDVAPASESAVSVQAPRDDSDAGMSERVTCPGNAPVDLAEV
jgi:GT2 family glycosyltransferase